ncbi:ABC transporter permease [Anatilimnocola floriformis]|uniref:ABC transporter permease n=1 Tax=Anatilimnocola floriformis TaxID=2948575 RepID=UPI0020C42111|nr:ABC transporter permease [Anatilimnocola floriformis]
MASPEAGENKVGRFTALGQLILTRIRLFLREPAAIFWVYGFPILMLVALGIAFRDNPRESIVVDLVGEGKVAEWKESLAADKRFEVKLDTADWQKRLQSGKTDLVIELGEKLPNGFQLWEEPRRAESRYARSAVENAMLRREQPSSAAPAVKQLQQAGSRYIDFLLPGMIGMGLMGGGMWGVGFVVVDMRVRKLLKLYLATPMRRSDFLVALLCSRLLFTLADVIVLLVFGYFVFGVACQGSYLDLTIATLIGGAAFGGIGLLVASRAQTLETVSGLMNLVILPMWVFSGVFFSSERFPEVVQPIINLLPLTALNQLLRGIMLEDKSLAILWPQTLLLSAYAIICFGVALKVFRWK